MDSITNGVARSAPPSLRVIIIGAGFSGTLVAVHLLRQSEAVQVDIVDRSLPGRGLAYSTVYHEHLLNVPAVRMSAFGSEPLHFLDWLRTHGLPAADPGLFAPRRLFGTYIQDLLETTIRNAGSHDRLRHHFSEAVRVGFDGLSVNVSLRNGERLRGDKVVLALGNPATRNVVHPIPGYYPSPWRSDALSGLDPAAAVLLVGAGLTSVDAFLALLSQGHVGPIHMLSRRGKLPQAHEQYRPLPEPFHVPSQPTARGLLRAVRSEIEEARKNDVNWRAVIDSIRPVTNDLWQKLDGRERLRFFRHLKTWWDIHRHRMATEIAVKVEQALVSGQLSVHAGRLQELSTSANRLQARLHLRTGARTTLNVDRVVNCTGPWSDYRVNSSALIRSLLDSGYAVPGSIGVGLHTNEHGELIGADGNPVHWLTALGPPRLGDLLETTAVPELRKQAEAIANHLLSINREPLEIMPELFMAAGI